MEEINRGLEEDGCDGVVELLDAGQTHRRTGGGRHLDADRAFIRGDRGVLLGLMVVEKVEGATVGTLSSLMMPPSAAMPIGCTHCRVDTPARSLERST